MRYLPFILIFAATAQAQESVPLEVKGDTKIVKVDRIVVLKDDLLLVNSLPFTVNAPPGGFGYVWDVPDGWKFKRKGSAIEIVQAPKGPATIGVDYSVVDFDKRVVISKYGSISFAVGDVPSPIPPIPPKPPPADPFMRKVWDAYQTETASNKSDMKSFLAAIYRERATDLGKAATTKDLLAVMHSAWLSVHRDSDLFAVRKVIFAEAKIPDGPIDSSVSALCKSEFAKIATALEYLP